MAICSDARSDCVVNQHILQFLNQVDHMYEKRCQMLEYFLWCILPLHKHTVNSREPPETDVEDGTTAVEFHPNAAGDRVVKKDKSEDDSYHLPMRLINLLEEPKNWKNRCLDKNTGVYDKGKELYSKVHQNPLLYKNLYEYLLFR